MDRRRRIVASLALALLAASALAGEPSAPSPAPPPTLEDARRALAAGDAALAARLLDDLLAREPERGPAWALLGSARAQAGDGKGALAAYERAAGFPAVRPLALYNAACLRALSGEKGPALESLAAARAAGFRRLGLLERDPDLASLRADPKWGSLFPTPAESAALFRGGARVIRVLHGESPGDCFGWVGRAAGDADGDGVPDLVLTAPFAACAGKGSGRVHLHSGRTGREILHADGDPGDALGSCAAPAGDVDGDGRADLLVGAPAWGTGRPGSARVISGKDGSLLRRIAAPPGALEFGERVALSGDLDGDGAADHLVAAPGPRGGTADPGAVFAFSGRDGRLLWTLRGGAPGERFGSALAGDPVHGSRMVVVGAEDAGREKRGRVLVHRGGAEGAEPLFAVEAGAASRGLGMMFASVVGDVDGDGTADVYASDWEDDSLGARTGRALAISGKDGRRILDLPGAAAGEGFGIGFGAGGDADRDGRADLAVGAWQSGAGGAAAGRAAVISGRDGREILSLACLVPGETFGFDATAVGDLDGDGGGDFLFTAAYSGYGGPRTGRAFVIAGPVPTPAPPSAPAR